MPTFSGQYSLALQFGFIIGFIASAVLQKRLSGKNCGYYITKAENINFKNNVCHDFTKNKYKTLNVNSSHDYIETLLCETFKQNVLNSEMWRTLLP